MQTKHPMADERENMSMEDLLKGAIQLKIAELSESFKIEDNLNLLLSNLVIDITQKQEIEAEGQQRGLNHATELFWTMVLRGDISVLKFMDAMRQSSHWICGTLDEGAENIRTGKWKLHGEPDLDKIRKCLEKKYVAKEWTDLEVIPDESAVTISLEEQLLEPVFKAKSVQASALVSRGMIRLQQDIRETDYESVDVKSLQDALKHAPLLEDGMNAIGLQPRLVELLGVAGTGKTTFAKQLTWLWATGKCDYMKNYDFVFFIPTRVITKNKLMDILCELGLLPDSEKDGFRDYLQMKERQSKVLFIVDGVDESEIQRESDLFFLVTGQLFPNAAVIMTARPEAICLGTFLKKPRVKVTLDGTNKASVTKLLEDALRGISEADIQQFSQRYDDTIYDDTILFIPLYLTLICVVLKDELATGLKCTQLRIPNTMTRLFNAMMRVIASRWLRRMNHKTTYADFNNSPLDSDSTLPAELKRMLFSLCRICYKGLARNKYQFSDLDAEENYLDMDDIRSSGLFTVGQTETGKMFFTRHKQLQEYLAALYLAREGITEPHFHSIMHHKNNTEKSLSDVIRESNLMKVVQFTCGVSFDFLKKLFKIASSLCCIHTGHIVDFYYEAVLFMELNSDIDSVENSQGFCELRDYFTSTKIKCMDFKDTLANMDLTNVLSLFQNMFGGKLFHRIYVQASETKALQRLISMFGQNLAVQLLNRFYDMNISAISCTHNGDSPEAECQMYQCGRSDVNLVLDQLQSELLARLCIGDVETITVRNVNSQQVFPAYLDIPALLTIFPHLKALDIQSNRIRYYSRSSVVLNTELNSKLTKITLFCTESLDTMPRSHLEALFLQTNLTHLMLSTDDMLGAINRHSDLQQNIWTKLEHLTVMNSFRTPEDVSGLCVLVKANSATLMSCKLGCRVSEHVLETNMQMLEVQVKKIGGSSESESNEGRDETIALLKNILTQMTLAFNHFLADFLPALTGISALELELYVLTSMKEKLALSLMSLTQLKSLTFTEVADSCAALVLVKALPSLKQLCSLHMHIFIPDEVKTELTNTLKCMKGLVELTLLAESVHMCNKPVCINWEIYSQVLAGCVPHLPNLKKVTTRDKVISCMDASVIPRSIDVKTLVYQKWH